MITVIDVMRSMRLECNPAVTWPIGARVRDFYENMSGSLPTKVLRPKTNSGGTHCFAVYPETMRPDIERIIRLFTDESARQGELPF